MNINATATTEGAELILNHMEDRITHYVLLGADGFENTKLTEIVNNANSSYETVKDYIIFSEGITSAYYDVNGLLTFDLPLPYEADLEMCIYGTALVAEHNGDNIIVSISGTPKIMKTKGIGGSFIYKLDVAGEAGTIIFANNTEIASDEEALALIRGKAVEPHQIKLMMEQFGLYGFSVDVGLDYPATSTREFTKNGFYRIPSVATQIKDRPTSNAFYMIVMNGGITAGYVKQLAFLFDSPQIYSQECFQGVWQDWEIINPFAYDATLPQLKSWDDRIQENRIYLFEPDTPGTHRNKPVNNYGILFQIKYGGSDPWQIAVEANGLTKIRTFEVKNADWGEWRTVGGYSNATSVDAGLMSATDKAKLDSLSIIPKGVITMWSGAVNTIPSGWALCDGNNSTPDLRNRFVIGAGSTYTPGNTGGAALATSSSSGNHSHTNSVTHQAGAHTHTGGAVGYTTLTTANMPSHNHYAGIVCDNGTLSIYGGDSTDTMGSKGNVIYQSTNYPRVFNPLTSTKGSNTSHYHSAGNTGSSGAHSHNMNNTGNAGEHTHTVNTMPSYYALAYIMKI